MIILKHFYWDIIHIPQNLYFEIGIFVSPPTPAVFPDAGMGGGRKRPERLD